MRLTEHTVTDLETWNGIDWEPCLHQAHRPLEPEVRFAWYPGIVVQAYRRDVTGIVVAVIPDQPLPVLWSEHRPENEPHRESRECKRVLLVVQWIHEQQQDRVRP